MNLGNIFQSKNPDTRQVNVPGTGGTVSAGERNYRIQSEIRNMVPGQTIQGEVVGKEGSTIQIALDGDTVLTARLERELNVVLGQSMSFEVKTNSGSQLLLAPLYANMANQATILKALSAAGLPESADNIRMVSNMMQEGMPIDRDSLAYVSRQLIDFPDADPSSIIQMIRLGLPVSESNIEQFEAYKNYEHQILQSAEQIMEEIPQTFQELLAEGKDAEAVSFYEQILKAFTGGGAAGADGQPVIGEQAGEAGAVDGAAGGNGGEILPEALAGTFEKAEAEVLPEAGKLPDGAEALKGAPAEMAEAAKGEQAETGKRAAVLQESEGRGNVGQEAVREAPERAELPPRVWQRIGDMFQKLGADETLAKQVGSGGFSPKEALTQLHDLIAGNPHTIREGFQEDVKELFGSREFRELLEAGMKNDWLIRPEEVADKEKVEQLYARIREQTARIEDAFHMAGKADSAGAKSVQNLQNNVDFMNQMNHLFTYIQLPLKMAGNEAHGDLYVYTNKKSLAKKDGNVSALLHLDMEHLGPLDVYVAMQKNLNKVSTNFTVKDEAALDLIASHIHILNERLEKRGYSMKANFQIREDGVTNMMREILEQNKNISVLSKTSFDMRA
ncbi:MAG: flagellar hook-length control protein FliK [Blautia sp.]|nr:flagellar hook-length control protein FliK [Blautia sp.]MCM1201735.1 flagellar hook-length control protein FliK [Bacteroides fragilis]